MKIKFMNNNFCHLHVHDQYSILDGFGSCEMYVAIAKKNNQSILTLTNHMNIDGIIKFQKCCIDNGIKPIIGCELYIVEDLSIKIDKEQRGHILILVKNQNGWNNLTKMLSLANIDGFYKRPRIDYKTIINNNDGLIIGTACTASFINNNGGIDLLSTLIKNKADIFFEIMPIDYSGQKKHNKEILRLQKLYPTIDLVATNDCHYPNKEDNVAQEVLLALQTKVKWNDKKRWKFAATDLFLKSREEMSESFAKNNSYINKEIVKKSLDNTIKIADKCTFILERSPIYLPSIVENEYETLKKMANDSLNLKNIQTGNFREYRNRLQYELDILNKLGFIKYFLIIHNIVTWCKQNDILIGFGRGSCGGSLIAFLIGITSVDPIKHKLMFERFISPDRIDLPDIDIDFEDTKRKQVRKYIESKFGEYNTASVATFLQMKSKMVFKDVCRVFDIPLDQVNLVSKNIDDFKEQKYYNDQRVDLIISDIKKVFDIIPECIRFKKKYPQIVDLCIKLEGQVRGIGKHAAAIIVTEKDLRDSNRCNITNRDGDISINWDKKDAEYVGMLKIDVLGLSNLSLVTHIIKLIKEKYNKNIVFDQINFNDKKIFNEFAKGNCNGIFQFGSYGLKKLCVDLKVDSFELLTHITAIYRPAFLRSGAINNFKDRRFKNEREQNKILNEVLSDTYGMIIYQEQVIQLIHRVAGLSFTEADKIRKLLDIEDKEKIMGCRDLFIKGCTNNGIKKSDAIGIWIEIVGHGGYGFNKCLSKDTTILAGLDYSKKNTWLKKKRMTIEKAYNDKITHIWIYDSVLKKIKCVKIKNIYKTGTKETYWVVVQSNKIRKIRVTKDHKFLTPNGYKPLSDLSVGDKVMTKIGNNCGEKNGAFNKKPWNCGVAGYKQKSHSCPEIWTKEKQSISAKKRLIHGHTNCLHTNTTKQICREAAIKQKNDNKNYTFTSIHKTIWEEMIKRNMNDGFENEYNLLNKFSINIANPDKKIAIEIQGDYWHANPKIYNKRNKTQSQNVGRDTTKRHLLEKEGWELIVLWENEIQNNLEYCMNKIECAIGDTLDNPWGFAEITYIGLFGEEETYDIEVDDEEHNYIANMFVVHNSHAVGYTLLSYTNMFFKVYYPTEFYCASLTYANDQDKKSELIREAKNSGIEIATPKIEYSDSLFWTSKDKTIYMPFLEIKGIGEKYAEKILNLKKQRNNGFFKNDDMVKGKLKEILNEVGAFDIKNKYIKSKYISLN